VVLISGTGAGQPIDVTFGYNPLLPLMGVPTQEGFALDVQTLLAFDTTYSYQFNSGTKSFEIIPSTMPVIWHGTDHDFFFSTNYADAFWTTNNIPGLHGWKVTLFAGASAPGPTATVNVTTDVPNTIQMGDFVYFLNTDIPNNNAVLGLVTSASNSNPFTVQATNLPSTSTFAWQNGATTKGLVLDSTQVGNPLAVPFPISEITAQDGIRYLASSLGFGPSASTGFGWVNYNPPIDLNNALAGALMIFPYRGYLVFLNTWEGNDQGIFNFGNRARWTEIGTPYYSFPVPNEPNPQGVDINAARDDLFGRGGANDAPTNEVIISAGFIRDILVVFFERSTWRLRFVNNAQNPFVWERVNIELGSSCTFSSIPFDKGLMSISNRGIIISDGNDTIRFDEKIPDDFFDIRQNNFGLNRVYGIRTFRTKLAFWTFPSTDKIDAIFPDKVLVFNYDTKTWSFFDDSFTCFGYYYPATPGVTWNDLPKAWAEYDDVSWNSGVSESGYENTVAGNQQGFVLQLEQNIQNDPSLALTGLTDSSVTTFAAVFTSPNHNLETGDWVYLSGVSGTTSDDGVSLNGRNFRVANDILDPNNFMLTEFKPIDGGLAVGTSYTTTVLYKNILVGSAQINIGTQVFNDPNANGILKDANGIISGSINYATGLINLTFSPSITSTEVWIRVVSLDPLQGFDDLIFTLGTYIGSGTIGHISGYGLTSKFFNFLKNGQRARLSMIDFYVGSTSNGAFNCDIYADSSNQVVNVPLKDAPLSNQVITSPSPYQLTGDEVMFRLYANAQGQTLQFDLSLTDTQLANDVTAESNITINALVVHLRQGGRLV
jgi:hypothetical protein